MTSPTIIHGEPAFPPSSTAFSRKTIGPVTLPPLRQDLDITFGDLVPASGTFTTPGGSQSNTVPTLFWGDPTTYTTTGCNGGAGWLTIRVPDQSTGDIARRVVAMSETPRGSGTYRAEIPPLAPMHGLATFEEHVVCIGHTQVLPDGGPPDGGTAVLLSGTGFTGTTRVSFGDRPAQSFEVLDDSLISAQAPAGSGSVPVTITTGDGATVSPGQYSYFDVTSLETTAGPIAGGTRVTIHGQGFQDVRGVLFGLAPATDVDVISATEVRATAPPGVGTVRVQVANSFAFSPLGDATFQYQGSPQWAQTVVEGTGPTAQVLYAAALQQGFRSNPDSVPPPVYFLQNTLANGVRDIFVGAVAEAVVGAAIYGGAYWLTGDALLWRHAPPPRSSARWPTAHTVSLTRTRRCARVVCRTSSLTRAARWSTRWGIRSRGRR